MQEAFEVLVREACAQQLLADVWLCAEIASVHNSEAFFLFEDILRWEKGRTGCIFMCTHLQNHYV
jgi:hypothetical protein